jgi:uroporphyrinogen-III synthase
VTPKTPPGVWVTRTQPGAQATADRVRAAGFEAFVAPLLEVVFEAGGEIDLAGITALAFTSANGVRAFAARSASRSLPVYTVGRGTATAARAAGFQGIVAGEGDVMALGKTIPPEAVVLHPGAAEPAADLVSALEGRDIAAKGLVVYRTVSAMLTKADLTAAAASDFVLLQSAKAALAFRDLGLDHPRPICLSEAVGQALASVAVTVASAPTEDDLITALLDAAR